MKKLNKNIILKDLFDKLVNNEELNGAEKLLIRDNPDLKNEILMLIYTYKKNEKEIIESKATIYDKLFSNIDSDINMDEIEKKVNKKIIEKNNITRRERIILNKKVIIPALAALVIAVPVFFLLKNMTREHRYPDREIAAASSAMPMDFVNFLDSHYENHFPAHFSTMGVGPDGERISDYDRKSARQMRMASVVGDIFLTMDLISEGVKVDANQKSLAELVNEMRKICLDSKNLSPAEQESVSRTLYILHKDITREDFKTTRPLNKIDKTINSILEKYGTDLFEEDGAFKDMLNHAAYWYYINGKAYLTNTTIDNTKMAGHTVMSLVADLQKGIDRDYRDSTVLDVQYQNFVFKKLLRYYFPTVKIESIEKHRESNNKHVFRVPQEGGKYWTVEISSRATGSSPNTSPVKVLYVGVEAPLNNK